MSNSVAFVCPLYDMKNHFDLAIDLLKSKIDYKIKDDFYFIFTNETQKSKFEEMAMTRLKINVMSIILPQEMDKYAAKAVTKKLYGLKYFMEEYEYIILVDCESRFVRECDYRELCRYIWDNRTMLNANKSPNAFDIMRKCYITMGLYNNKSLRKELSNYKYNFWFNDLQVYKCQYLPGFFEWLEDFSIEDIYNESCCFEYYVFFAYLHLIHDFHIKKFKYESAGGINEYIDLFDMKKQNEIISDMDLHWTSSRNVDNDNIVMLFHLDRDKSMEEYGYTINLSRYKRLVLKLHRIKTLITDGLSFIFN